MFDNWVPRKAKKDARIHRLPVAGMGMGVAMASASDEIPVDPRNVIASLDRISPEVWIEFGKQIESRKALEAVGQSMQPREVMTENEWIEYKRAAEERFRNPERAWEEAAARESERRENARTTAENYLRNRQWH